MYMIQRFQGQALVLQCQESWRRIPVCEVDVVGFDASNPEACSRMHAGCTRGNTWTVITMSISLR